MSGPYPQRNPFPYQGVATVEGQRIGLAKEEMVAGLPTLLLDPIARTLKLTGKYLETAGERGQILGLRGEHGAGKTHAMRYVWARLKQDSIALCQVYAKAEGPDFLGLYRVIVPQISQELLRDLCRSFFAGLAASNLKSRIQDADARGQLEERLRSDPAEVERLLGTYFLEQGWLDALQASEVGSLANEMREFQRVFSFLDSPGDLGARAYEWLQGKEPSEADRRRLGVAGPIRSAEAAKWGLQVLVTLFGRAGRPLILYLDQFEKLVLDPGGNLVAQNAGLLHSLVEVVPRERCMLMVAGNEEAWNALPRDLTQRFARQIVSFPVLTLAEAGDLVRLYLTPPGEEFRPGGGDGLYPFSEEAIKRMLVYGAGNVRRLLQTCWEAFEAAGPERREVGADLIEAVVGKHQHTAFQESTVRQEIEKILIGRSLAWRREFRVGSAVVDFAVMGPDGAPRVLIEVSQALFLEDEARQALDQIEKLAQSQASGLTARFIVVVVGYVSPEVLEKLRLAAHDVLVYEPETFAARFRGILDQISSGAKSEGSTSWDSVERELSAVRSGLESILKTRQSEQLISETRLTELLTKQEAGRLEQRRESARAAWGEERRRITAEIQKAREERKRAELAEIEVLRRKAEAGLRRRWAAYSAVGGIAAAILFLSALLALVSDTPSAAVSLPLRAFAAAVTVGAVVYAAVYFGYLWVFRPLPERELAGPISSLSELDPAARQFGRSRTSGRPHRSPNPQVRYVAALAGGKVTDPGEWAEAYLREPSSAVRRVLARRMGAGLAAPPDWALQAGEILETVYALESGAELPLRRPSIPAVRLMSGMDETLAGALVRAVLFGQRPDLEPVPALLEAFERGVDRAWSPLFDSIPERQIREAKRELSPFEEGGLGTCDYLADIEKADRMYLLFCQLEFYAEREALA
ncbi:MAG: hypothetical protein HY822_21550 [Acidobacteria bacterium]|nr:hypothetical protein [Acidobacteriota bacterium]